MENQSASSHNSPYQTEVDKLACIKCDASVEEKGLLPLVRTLLLETCLFIVPNFFITFGDGSLIEVKK